MVDDRTHEDAKDMANQDKEVEARSINEIGELIAEGSYDDAIKVINKTANGIKFNTKLNKAAKKRAMDNLRSILANVQSTARAMGEDRSLRSEFKQSWSLCYVSR
tara:strand:- start:150 stop:464 length:315 start_codon:yes stop_codon:yes gene_type:complete